MESKVDLYVMSILLFLVIGYMIVVTVDRYNKNKRTESRIHKALGRKTNRYVKGYNTAMDDARTTSKFNAQQMYDAQYFESREYLRSAYVMGYLRACLDLGAEPYDETQEEKYMNLNEAF